MAPRNPSEYARLEEEREELLDDLKKYWPKAQKEQALRQIHTIDRILGRKLTPYNGT